MPIELSIIIVTWNSCEITKKAIDSIRRYLKKINYEIILVDNASTDSTLKTFSKLKYLTYLHNSENLGFSKANNIGAKSAHGRYFLFLNSDMCFLDDSLLNMIEFLKSHSQIGAIGPQLLNLDSSLQASVFPPQTITNAFKEYWLKQSFSFSKYNPSGQLPTSVWAISGGAFLISHNLFSELGGWNESYFFYFEDLDFCTRLHQHNYQIYFYPQCRIIHYHGFSGKSLSSSANQWRRLIPSSIIYHGRFKHYLLSAILWLGQKLP
ncbi:glycosyltransferase family 2 protein [Patescibacteria group bacterium]|nr:glycosyltransferase family 2 protein [Patescibacteria group bacterium]